MPFLYVLERHGDPDEAVRKLPDGGEGDGRIDQIRIQRIAVADADPEPLPEAAPILGDPRGCRGRSG